MAGLVNGSRRDPDDLLETLLQSYRHAASTTGGAMHRRYTVGDRAVALHLAGATLSRAVLPALAHNEVSGSDAVDLDVHMWDGASTGVPLPVDDPLTLPAWRRRAPWSTVSPSGVRTIHQPVERVLGLLADRVAVQWTADADSLPFYERSAPLLHILHWWLGSRGIMVVHGGAAGRSDGGVLMVGPSGSGKTTASVAGFADGLAYAGDDYVAVGLEPPRVYSLYCSVKVERAHAERLASLMPSMMSNPEPYPGDKALYFIERDLATSFPLRAMVLPRVSSQTATQARPVSPGEALAALAPSSVLQLPGTDREGMAGMRRLCQAVPAYALELGSDLTGIAPAIHRLLDQ